MKNKENILFILFFPWAFMVLMATWSVVQLEGKIKRLENQPKTIIYKVDNAGGIIDQAGGIIDQAGKISAKNVLEGRYTVTIKAYGNFLVTKEQYDSLKVGDPIPDYLKIRGN